MLKQTIIVISTMKSEFIALNKCGEVNIQFAYIAILFRIVTLLILGGYFEMAKTYASSLHTLR